MGKGKDLTGQKFGHLTVIEMLYDYEKSGKKRTVCRCICDCGNEKIADPWHIQNRPNASCGCMVKYYRALHNRTNEIGNKYGRLLITGIDYSVKPSVAICKCDCGNIIRRNKAEVVCGDIQSCGCLHRDRVAEVNTKDFTDMVSDSGVVFVSRAYKNKKSVWMWNCICPICGETFVALPAKVMENHTTSCGCKVRSSKERIIEKYIKDLDVPYERQKRFPDCKYHYTLPFDFAIYDNDGAVKCLIEYDGQQHFKSVALFGGDEAYEQSKIRDKIKDDYCKEKNILLIRLNYLHTNKEMKEIITNTIYP